MYKFLFLCAVVFLSSCRAIVNPNEWVVSTADCWNHVSVTKAGDYIPKLYTSCDRMIILPATFMSADFSVDTKFQNRVAGKVNVTYQWRISDPILFSQSAKSLTSSPTDNDYKIDANTLEAVENTIVDKMFIDVIREYSPNKAAGVDELIMEKEIMELVKFRFNGRGVEFASPSINTVFSPQIEEALDVMSALDFYETNGEKELGKDVIKAKAGSAKIQTWVQDNK